MYTLKEVWTQIFEELPIENWDGNLLCIDIDAPMLGRANKVQSFMAAYSFVLVTEGWIRLQYNAREVTIERHKIMVCFPRIVVKMLDISPDFRGIWLAADERLTLEMSAVRNAVRMAFSPIVVLTDLIFALEPQEVTHFEEVLRLLMRYFRSQYPHKEETLRMLYNVFLLDLSQKKGRQEDSRAPQRMEELFMDFQRLLSLHFAEHHDIAFYADKMAITPTYLSRIVKEVSGGGTVVEYINRMLLMEASFLLRQTNLTMTQIADRLCFAEATTFSRFFTREKGMTPKEYREGRQ